MRVQLPCQIGLLCVDGCGAASVLHPQGTGAASVPRFQCDYMPDDSALFGCACGLTAGLPPAGTPRCIASGQTWGSLAAAAGAAGPAAATAPLLHTPLRECPLSHCWPQLALKCLHTPSHLGVWPSSEAIRKLSQRQRRVMWGAPRWRLQFCSTPPRAPHLLGLVRPQAASHQTGLQIQSSASRDSFGMQLRTGLRRLSMQPEESHEPARLQHAGDRTLARRCRQLSSAHPT